MTKNFKAFTFHFGEPRRSAALTFHKKDAEPFGYRVKMYGLGHPIFGFIGFMRFTGKLTPPN